MLFNLAYKNLWRNRRRTLLTEISILFGVLVIIGSGNFINGMQRDWAKFEINSNTGAFQVEHRDYQDMRKSEPLQVTLENGAALVDKISKMPGVRTAYGKLNFSGMVSSGLKSTFFDGKAVDVAGQRKTLTQQSNLIVAGKPLGDSTGGIVLGADLASMPGIKIGDPVTIVVQTLHGGLNLTYGTLVGTKNGRHFPSSTYLEMPLDDAQKLLRVHDRVSQVVVGVDDFDGIPALMQRVEAELRNGQTPFTLRGDPVVQAHFHGRRPGAVHSGRRRHRQCDGDDGDGTQARNRHTARHRHGKESGAKLVSGRGIHHRPHRRRSRPAGRQRPDAADRGSRRHPAAATAGHQSGHIHHPANERDDQRVWRGHAAAGERAGRMVACLGLGKFKPS